MTTLLDRVLKLMDSQGVNAATLTAELGISKTSFTDWKKGKGKPSLDAVVKFSDYFNVSIDYLVRGEEFPNPIRMESPQITKLDYSNTKDSELLLKLHSLPPEMQERVHSYADGMLAASSSVSEGKKLSV